MTHIEYIKKHKPATDCAASHITFGGKCMNCGYDPAKNQNTVAKTRLYNTHRWDLAKLRHK